MPFRSEECAQDAGEPAVGACAGCDRHGCKKCLTEVGGGWLCAACAEARRGRLHLPVFAHFTPTTWWQSVRTYARTPRALRWLHARVAEPAAVGLVVLHATVAAGLATLVSTLTRDDLEPQQVAIYVAVAAAAWMATSITVARLVARVTASSRADAALRVAFVQLPLLPWLALCMVTVEHGGWLGGLPALVALGVAASGAEPALNARSAAAERADREELR